MIDGNLKPCGNDAEPVRLDDGDPVILGVLGAVTTPGCRLEGLSGKE